MKAIQVRATGGPEVLEYVDVPKPEPREGETLVRIEATGVNYIDVYHRTGLYKMPLPFIPGSEAAGVVEETGERVAWAMVQGAYSEYAAVPNDKLVPLPASIDVRSAAAAMLQGMTAHYLVTSTFALREGHTALVHAAAGGVGGLLVQMAKARGAHVVATASPAKHEEVIALGADEVLDYSDPWPEGMNVVYDSVGQTTFDRSLDALAVRGMLVLFGQSSGAVPPFDPQILNAKGSLFLTRPTLGHYTATREELTWRAGDLFRWMGEGRLDVRIDQTFPLAEAAAAHHYLADRKSKGKVLLVP
jgi:NADPH2:quinone reductase